MDFNLLINSATLSWSAEKLLMVGMTQWSDFFSKVTWLSMPSMTKRVMGLPSRTIIGLSDALGDKSGPARSSTTANTTWTINNAASMWINRLIVYPLFNNCLNRPSAARLTWRRHIQTNSSSTIAIT